MQKSRRSESQAFSNFVGGQPSFLLKRAFGLFENLLKLGAQAQQQLFGVVASNGNHRGNRRSVFGDKHWVMRACRNVWGQCCHVG